MRPQILYHRNCYDGFGAALAAWMVHADNADYHACQYGETPPKTPPGAQIRIFDFSFPKAVLVALKERNPDLLVFDHHKTAQADLEGLDFCTFDMERSGATLAYDHYFGGRNVSRMSPRREFFEYLEDRDLWRFALPHSREFSAGLRSFPFEFPRWRGFVSDVTWLIGEGTPILRYQQQAVETISANARMVEIGGYRIPAVNTSWLFSEVASDLLRRFPDAPFSAAYFDRTDGMRQWSLRSEDHRVDVSEVAKSLGGGGHRNASGYAEKA